MYLLQSKAYFRVRKFLMKEILKFQVFLWLQILIWEILLTLTRIYQTLHNLAHMMLQSSKMTNRTTSEKYFRKSSVIKTISRNKPLQFQKWHQFLKILRKNKMINTSLWTTSFPTIMILQRKVSQLESLKIGIHICNRSFTMIKT